MAGKPGYKHSIETRKKYSIAQMGNKKWLGKKHKEETKLKIGLANKGKIVSIDTQRKISEALKGKKWTLERRLEWSERKKGSGNNNWKNGVTPINRLVRNTYQYREWSKQVRGRDGKCMECGSIEQLQAHHIERFIFNEENRFKLENGITLCEYCHFQYHHKEKGLKCLKVA